jgi:hypothetical protein
VPLQSVVPGLVWRGHGRLGSGGRAGAQGERPASAVFATGHGHGLCFSLDDAPPRACWLAAPHIPREAGAKGTSSKDGQSASSKDDPRRTAPRRITSFATSERLF